MRAGMTMVFSVKDKAAMDKLKAGDKVRVKAVNETGKFAVVETSFSFGSASDRRYSLGRTRTLSEGEDVVLRPDVPRPGPIASKPRNAFNDAEVEALGHIVIFRDGLRRDGHCAGRSAVLGRCSTKTVFFLICERKAIVWTQFEWTE